MTRIAIIGGSGYTALELIKILLRHPAAEIVAVTT
ncbi:MAG TPA: N-acetyl-gamma-glutamyl-phosphate reductase, partial [Gemmataceae bacterium]|nr:N-acetyl-gamma-glutamyl-phosphate reductase [Gemmataceae bacterium]